jgi:hypothetical protein
MFPRTYYKTKVDAVSLPNELWLIILDIVIEEGIIWLDQCDYTTFLHTGSSLTVSARHYRCSNSYWRLRLVCRTFNALLGARPRVYFLGSSLLPLPHTIRALDLALQLLPQPDFQCLLAERPTCARLVYLDVECYISPKSNRLNVSDFLREGRAFCNVQRLTLRLGDGGSQVSFWTRLHYAFPSLATLAVHTGRGTREPTEELRLEGGDNVVCFERLGILSFSGLITYSGCHFPHLRHASVSGCTQPELEILTRSPDLESLLIWSYLHDLNNIDVASCLHLQLLGIADSPSRSQLQLGRDHSVEHIRLYSISHLRNSDFFEELLRLPKISRITVEFSECNLQYCWRRIDELQEMKFDSSGTSKAHYYYLRGFKPEWLANEVDGGVLKKVWSKMRG